MPGVTTYSNPKEMLGYLLVQWISEIREIAKYVYVQRAQAKALIFQIRLLDTQISTFRSDMYYQVGKEEYWDYWKTMKEKVEPNIEVAYSELQEKEYKAFVEGVGIWLELIASSYPKLGLVPETGISLGNTGGPASAGLEEHDNIIEDEGEVRTLESDESELPGEPVGIEDDSSTEPLIEYPKQPAVEEVSPKKRLSYREG